MKNILCNVVRELSVILEEINLNDKFINKKKGIMSAEKRKICVLLKATRI